MGTNPPGYMQQYYLKNKSKFNDPVKSKARARARRLMEKKVGKSKMKGKEVDHIKPLANGGSTKMSNLRLVSAKMVTTILKMKGE